MPVKKYKAKGKRGRVFAVQFTKNDNIPYQSFTLQDSDQVYSYFGGTDISLIPEGTAMEFQYEMRGRYTNVREIEGFDHIPKLDKKALKDDYLKEKNSEQNQSQYQDRMTENRESNKTQESEPILPEQKEYEKPFVSVPGQDQESDWISKDMELKIKMNAGNTVKSILELACNASARYENGAMDEDSFWEYYDMLMFAYDLGVEKISGVTLGYEKETIGVEETEEQDQEEQPNDEHINLKGENRAIE